MGNNWLSREGRGGRSGVLATNSLHFPSTRPYVTPGRRLGSRPISGGCWLGPEKLLLGGSRAHAACLPHAHDPLPSYREQKEECQGWDMPSDLPAPFLVLILTHPLLYSFVFPEAPGIQFLLLSFPSGMYSCPCYYYPNRAGSSDRASFVIGIDLRCGTMTSDHWIKRGTALLMSLDN